MLTQYLQLPTEDEREKTRNEVNSTKESVQKDVRHLIEWLEKQPHLANITDEDVLSHMLLNCKNSLEKTKARLEMYMNTKAIMPEIFRNRNPFDKEIEEQTQRGMYVPLPKLTPHGYRVVMLFLSDSLKTETDFSSIPTFFKLNQMTLDVLGKLDYPKGVIIIHDGKNLSMPLIGAFSAHLQKLVLLCEKAVPVRYKKLYFCNMGQASDLVITMGKNLLKKQLAERIQILKNPSDLCKVLPKEIIPREYGGDELPLSQLKDLWYEELKRHHDYLRSTEEFITDLSKVPKDLIKTDLSGLNGSFRQISFD